MTREQLARVQEQYASAYSRKDFPAALEWNDLVFRLRNPLAFERRGIPARCVAPRLRAEGYAARRRALRSGRHGALGARLVSETEHQPCGSSPTPPPFFTTRRASWL